MNEYTLQLIQIFKIFWIAGYVALYGFGGIKHKEIRRVYGSLWVAGGICLFSALVNTFSWWFLLIAPLYYGASTFGYGADNIKDKIFKRLIQGMLFTIAALPIAIVTQNWLMF